MVQLSKLKLNDGNPRFIRDEKFERLVKSIKEFPKMMKLRPIIIDNEGVILGGNMRYRALLQIGYKEVPDEWVKKADELNEDEKRRFVIADNVGFGEWDFEILANEWDSEELGEWGMELPYAGSEFNNMNEDDLDMNEEFDPIGESKGLQRVVFLFNSPQDAESYLKKIGVSDYQKNNMAWQVNFSDKYGK